MPLKTSPQNGQSGADVLGLREQLRVNSPDEVLGSMNQASLTQGIVMATAVTAVLMAVLTIGPYLLGSGSQKKKGAKSTAAAAAQNKEQTSAASQDTADGNAAAGDDSATAKASPGGNSKVSAKALKNLGVDDVKKTDPKKNPLENSVDDLLKEFRAHYLNGQKTSVASLRQPYDMLVLKVLSLLQDADPPLARTISGSREAIWNILADPEQFKSVI